MHTLWCSEDSTVQWSKFVGLSEQYRQMQLTLLMTATPESMDMKGLTNWGRLCSKCLAYAHRVEADKSQPEATREHWGAIRKHAVLQVERVAKSVHDFIETAEELTPWERCQIFELLDLCSKLFHDEANAIQLQLSLAGEPSSVPASVSTETLAKLAEFKANGQS